MTVRAQMSASRLRSAAALAVLASLTVGVTAAVPAAHAGPSYKQCGTLKKGDRTLKFKASNMTCKKARQILAAPTDDSARVKGHRMYSYSAAGCEGIVWTDKDREYSQANNGKLRSSAKTISYFVTRGCDS